MSFSFGEHIDGLTVGGRELHAGVFNENEVRAAAGVTLVVAAIAFSLAYFRQQYAPLQAASAFFFVEFLVRTTAGIRYSPVGVLARWMTLRQPPEWVSAKPKRFAWSIGLAMAFSMTIITNSGIRGTLPRTLCIICMALMWLEASLGICLGCELHGLLMRRGWRAKDPEIELCAHGVCAVPARSADATTTTTAG